METSTIEIFRVDPLTGCRNFLGFIEALEDMLSTGGEQPFSILYADLNYLASLNRIKGYAYGDTALRWIELVLREESHQPTFRLGGDDFGVILAGQSQDQCLAVLQKVNSRLSREAPQVDLPIPAASVALINYDSIGQLEIEDLFIHLVLAMINIKVKMDRMFHIFNSKELTLASIGSEPEIAAATLQQVTHLAVRRTLFMGRLLDTVQKSAYIDSTSGLPNLRAAAVELEKALKNSAAEQKPFTILLMDGDNLRLFNEISYAAGDEMIRNISTLLTKNLRPGDFVARWRAGDEFIAVLPGTSTEGALVVAERFRLAVRDASQAWAFPSSISIGVAGYPLHGADIESLIAMAESALKHAKDSGKNTVIVAE